MTPDEMRRAADLLEDGAKFFREYGFRDASKERLDLARLLREEAEAKELRQQYAAHGVPTPGECAAMQSPLPPPPQGREDPTKPRLPVETCPACGGTGWQD
jgi:hypothetical protein